MKDLIRVLKALRFISIIVPLLTPLGAAASTCGDADLLVKNGHIISMDPDHRVASSMAVRDGKILALGRDDELSHCSSSRTLVADLHGKTVLPGLIDIHTHALQWAKSIVLGMIDAGYPAVKSIHEVVEAVRARVAKTNHGVWVMGVNWDDAKLAEHRYITRHDLDAVAPDNPVVLTHGSGHLLVANTAALKLAGITRDTADPQGGVIERDSSGEPTGILKDEAMTLLAKFSPASSPDTNERAAKLVSEKAAEVGLTTIHDIEPLETIRGYQGALAKGDLQIRVQFAPIVSSMADAEKLSAMGMHTGFGNEYLKFGAVKMFADGGMGARTIAIYPPGVAGEPDNVGVLRWKPEEMQAAQTILVKAGWQLETHAIGDRAIDETLDSYAAVMQKLGLKDPRFRVVHCGISTPAIQKRLKDLHVLVDGNPPFIYWIGSWFTKYGPERVRWAYPAKSYIENGIIEGAGSDVPVTPISPWWGIWSAVERRELQSSQILAPEERITVEQALTLYTRNGAYVGFEEREKGSLESGKLADFIVIDRDVLRVPAEELKAVQVLQTYVGGKLVYDKPAASSSEKAAHN
jgi:predicted amidohydrolase YtcJ